MRQTTVEMVEVVPAKGLPTYKVTLEYAEMLVADGCASWGPIGQVPLGIGTTTVNHGAPLYGTPGKSIKRVYEKYVTPSLIPKMGPRGPEVIRQIPVKRRK